MPKNVSILEQIAHQSNNISYTLMKISIEAEGRKNAYDFAINSNGDIDKILREKEKYELFIKEGNDSGSAAPGATPRIYKESYITNLHEAYTLIQLMNKYNKKWNKEY
jgi:hypothetical protein